MRVHSRPVVARSSIGELAAPFALPDDPIVGAFRALQGPRPGIEALALAVDVPILAFSPAGIVPTLLLCLAVDAAILLLVTVLRRSVVVAVTQHALLLLDCGRIPGRWRPRSLLRRSNQRPLTDAARDSARRGVRLEFDRRATWVIGADQDEARRLAASITEAT